MTMPGKILLDTCEYDGHIEVVNEHATWAQPYIRADIAEDLAKALEALANHPAHEDTAMGRRAREALARFRA